MGLRDISVPQQGVYLENCKFVDWGYFGNLEVFSKQAFTTLVENLDRCYDELDWRVGSSAPWARISSLRSAWTCWVSVSRRILHSPLTVLARPIAQLARRKTISMCQRVPGCPPPRSTPSSSPWLGSIAGRRPRMSPTRELRTPSSNTCTLPQG